jgi:hypothetical protein
MQLHTATVSERGEAEPASRGTVRGIDYRTGMPVAREVFFVGEAAFVPEGTSASGSGVSDSRRKLVGLQIGWRNVKGHVEDTREGQIKRIEFNQGYFFTPMSLAVKTRKESGFGFILER